MLTEIELYFHLEYWLGDSFMLSIRRNYYKIQTSHPAPSLPLQVTDGATLSSCYRKHHLPILFRGTWRRSHVAEVAVGIDGN